MKLTWVNHGGPIIASFLVLWSGYTVQAFEHAEDKQEATDLILFAPEAATGNVAEVGQILRDFTSRLGERIGVQLNPRFISHPREVEEVIRRGQGWVAFLDGVYAAELSARLGMVPYLWGVSSGRAARSHLLIAGLRRSDEAQGTRTVAVSRSYEKLAGAIRILTSVGERSDVLVTWVNTAEDALLSVLLGASDAAMVDEAVFGAIRLRRPLLASMAISRRTAPLPIVVLCSGPDRHSLAVARKVGEALLDSSENGVSNRLDRHLLVDSWQPVDVGGLLGRAQPAGVSPPAFPPLSFNTGATRPLEGSEAIVRTAASYLTVAADAHVLVVGHTDEVGANDFNYRLGLERASVVRRLLSQAGVDLRKIRISSRGELEPIDGRATPEAYARNRRAELRIIIGVAGLGDQTPSMNSGTIGGR